MLKHINLANVLTVAQAEKRLTRRLKRYWLFLVLAFCLGTGIFIYYSVIHAFFSSFSATLGNINPHYLLSVVSVVFQAIFTLGIVFIAFDVRARDVRERIVEVLDCRPLSNLELILGRFFALFQLAWFPVLFLCLWLNALGWVLPRVGAPIGNTVELDSVIGFATLVSIPTFFFVISMVFLVTLLVRNRVLAVLLALAIIGGFGYGLFRLPVVAYPLVDIFGLTIATPFPTDMTTEIGTPQGWLQRFGFLIISCALLGFAAAIHPRLDDSNRKQTALLSGAILAIGGAFLVASTLALNGVAPDPVWVAAHEAVEQEAAPDIVRMDANISVDPGNALQAQVEVEVQAPANTRLDSLLFTLNPGFALDSVTDANGQALDATHANGLLRIALPLAAGQRTTLTLAYSGAPDNQFAYLDSRLQFESLADFNARGLSGTEPGMFDSAFVALMPGTYWLPLAGNDLNRDDTRAHGRDFFSASVEVEVPGAWLVAGPGARATVAAQQPGNVRFRFAPQPQVSEVALVAAEYVSYATDLDGIHFEFLMYPGHTQNFAVLAPMRGEIETWVKSRLQLAREAGLVYPFDAFTIVEVPNGLRVYRGGWRMDTALAPPAMMLMAESGFPTSRFDFSIQPNTNYTGSGNVGQQSLSINDDSFQNVSFERLLTFFTSDLSGGNLFMGISRSFFTHHTAALGEEAIALNFILDMLATLVVSDERYYFSMYNDINQTVTNLINSALSGGTLGDSITKRTIDSFATNVDVWNSALGQSLARIDTEREPEQTINLLTLKGGELAQAIYDVLGPVRSGQFLSALLRSHTATSFTLDDVVSTLATFDPNLSVLFEENFNSTELPGFIADRAEVYRLPDGPSGEQRYQLLVALRNDEPVAGFTRIAWIIQGGSGEGEVNYFSSEPIRVDGRAAVEFGVVLTTPPASALVSPYLSVNRTQFTAGIFNRDDIEQIDAEPFEGVRPLPWSDASERIVADDLDESFVVIDNNGTSSYDRTVAENDLNVPLDQGIRINQGDAPDDWNRIPSPTAYGKYRHTFVSVMAGDGDKKATLTSSIPRAGLWDLEVYIPAAAEFRTNNMKGIWNMTITSANGVEAVAFDNRAATPGWNLIGSYDLPRGDVKVEFTNQTDALVVTVDAIAWTPVNSNSEAAQ